MIFVFANHLPDINPLHCSYSIKVTVIKDQRRHFIESCYLTAIVLSDALAKMSCQKTEKPDGTSRVLNEDLSKGLLDDIWVSYD